MAASDPNSIGSNNYIAEKNFLYDANSKVITFMKDIKTANIYTVDGKLVKTFNVDNNNQVRLNIPAGLYIVRTIAKNGTVTSVKLNVK